MALAIPLGGMVYPWLRQRTLHARVIMLVSELDQRTTELEEANQTLNRLAGLDTVTSLANHSAFQEFFRDEWRRAIRGRAMSRTDQQGAFRVAHRICAGIEGLALEHPKSDGSPCVTASVGVATSTPAVDSS